jgi:hypothetical protein
MAGSEVTAEADNAEQKPGASVKLASFKKR